MTRPRRRLLVQAFVVLAIVSLASIALAPRGMLRAVAADELGVHMVQVDHSESIRPTEDAIHLPGVRAVVSREEQDPHQALLDVLVTTLGPGLLHELPDVRAQDVDAGTAGASHADAPPRGERGPPTAI